MIGRERRKRKDISSIMPRVVETEQGLCIDIDDVISLINYVVEEFHDEGARRVISHINVLLDAVKAVHQISKIKDPKKRKAMLDSLIAELEAPAVKH